MIKKKTIIIGAGLAGLTAGCYLQMNGYDTEIFEAHTIPGGLFTAWTRKGYIIEGCIHGLLGSSPSHPYYKLWNELIDMENIKFIDSDIVRLFNFIDGSEFIEYANLDKLEEYMKRIAPEDGAVIEEFIRDTKKFQTFELSSDKPKEFFDLLGKFKMIKALPIIPVTKKWIDVSAEQFSAEFNNPLLRETVKHFSSPILFEMFVLSEMDLKRCGYPTIGSLEISKQLEKKYLSCGGKINYNKRVSKVIVENNKSVGITLERGQNHYAHTIVSAIDGRTAIFDLLDGKYIDKILKGKYDKEELSPSKIQVSLGIHDEFENTPHTVKIILSSLLTTSDGSQFSSFDVLIYNAGWNLAPDKKTLLVVQLDIKNSDYWIALRTQDKEKYKIEKQSIAEQVIDILDCRLKSIKNNIDMIDVTTPATYERYTGNWKGSSQGWTNENIFKPNPFKKQLPGLENFYMIGQWVEPGGGIPNAFKSGRDLAQIICKRDRKKFMTTS